MKTIKYLNNFAVGLPFLLAATVFKETALLWSVTSTMATGFIQVILGLILLFKNPFNNFLIFYLLGVISFFMAWGFNSYIHYSDFLGTTLFFVPPFLAAYLTYIIYKKANL
jgi:hypothetical protein